MTTIMKDTPSMPPVSIVIPLRIESTEREANLHCVLQYLLRSPFVYYCCPLKLFEPKN